MPSPRLRPVVRVLRLLAPIVVLAVAGAACAPAPDHAEGRDPGGGTGVRGGGGGSGGGDGSTDSGNTALNTCSCIQTGQLASGQSCLTCMGNSVQPNGGCNKVSTACANDQPCVAVISCLQNCKGDVTCITTCTLPANASAGKAKFAEVAVCQCMACAKECNSYAATPACSIGQDAGPDALPDAVDGGAESGAEAEPDAAPETGAD